MKTIAFYWKNGQDRGKYTEFFVYYITGYACFVVFIWDKSFVLKNMCFLFCFHVNKGQKNKIHNTFTIKNNTKPKRCAILKIRQEKELLFR